MMKNAQLGNTEEGKIKIFIVQDNISFVYLVTRYESFNRKVTKEEKLDQKRETFVAQFKRHFWIHHNSFYEKRKHFARFLANKLFDFKMAGNVMRKFLMDRCQTGCHTKNKEERQLRSKLSAIGFVASENVKKKKTT